MEKAFLGIGWSFPPAFPRESGTVALSAGTQDIEESLRILIGTLPGERVMLPEYGASVRDLLFESMDTGTQTLLFDRMKTAILRFEPRIEVLELSLDNRFLTEGRIELRLDYRVRATNSRFNFVYPFYLAEGSQVETP
ncbi:GPW/gp25 family protein [Neolewinella lacunae]|uniref:GPW/gp25 family protein n=1 Tax=Neolewinella lacunae TaxID=1517758 RepID=A0A923T7U4_9BACT|nr:GPW/gp25 family protein [Neolewinella lacunae]MBC6993253.1 GPW/gp25 family protein [Neolewinella lacunae]MDN3635700.1 GPW/gp25 family protein [Neolewinella lacunae]